MEGLRDEANFCDEEFPSKGNRRALKHSGGQSHWHEGSHCQGLEKLPRSGLDDRN